MDPDRHCLDEAAPPGSSLHYATLFLNPRERAALVAVHALRHTLFGIVDTIADPDVRAHKLNWWSNEIMEARDERPRHPVAVAITRHCAAQFWRRPEVLAMLTAIGRASAAGGFESEAARDRFCEDVGGGTTRLCAAAVAAGTSDTSGPHDDIGALGSALEYAMLAGVPIARSGLMRIPNATSNAPERMEHDGPGAGAGHDAVAGRSPERIGRGGPDSTEPRITGGGAAGAPGTGPRRTIGKQTGEIPENPESRWIAMEPERIGGDPRTLSQRSTEECTGGNSGAVSQGFAEGYAGGGSDTFSQRIAEERARAHQALAGAVRDVPLRAGPAGLVYRTLAHIQLAALADALRKPAPEAPLQASITPIRKLWIAWRTARRAG